MKTPRPRSNSTFFPVGSAVEVSSDVDGFKGSWFTAKVIEPPPLPAAATPPERRTKRALFVEYQTLLSDDGSKLLAEFVEPVYVRPLPPLDPDGHTFEVNDVVDAWHLDGWWMGVVVEVWKESSYYRVCFEDPPEIIELKRSELRIHWDWDGCKWVRPRKKKIWQKDSGTGSSKRKRGERKTPLIKGSEDASAEKAAKLSDTVCSIREAEMAHFESPSNMADIYRPLSMWVDELCTPTVCIGKSVTDVVSGSGKEMKQTLSMIDETFHSPLEKLKVDIQLKEGGTGSPKRKTVHRKPLSKGKNCNGATGTVKEMKQTSSMIDATFHSPLKKLKMDIQLKEGGTGSPKRKTVHRKPLSKGKNCDGATGTVDKLAVKDHTIVGVESSENTGKSKGKECHTVRGSVGEIVVKDCAITDVASPLVTGESIGLEDASAEKAAEPYDTGCGTREAEMAIIKMPSNMANIYKPISTSFDIPLPLTVVFDSRFICGKNFNQWNECMSNRVPDENTRLPYVECPSILKAVESLEIFQKMPQKPHFRPLENCKELYREGLAIGYMLTFANVVKLTSNLQVNDPRSLYKSIFEALHDLELHGFNIMAVQRRLTELQSTKERQELLKEVLKESKLDIVEQTHEQTKTKEELDEVVNQMKVLEERKAKLMSVMEKYDSQIAETNLKLDIYSLELRNTELDFESIASAPW